MAVRALIVEDEAARLAVNVDVVRAVVSAPELTPVPTAPPVVLGLANVRGEIVTVLDARLLQQVAAEPIEAAPFVVVVQTAVGLAGLAVQTMPETADVDDEEVVDVDRLLQEQA